MAASSCAANSTAGTTWCAPARWPQRNIPRAMSSMTSRSPAARTRPCACPRCMTMRSTGKRPTCSSLAAASRACRSRASLRARSSTFSSWIRNVTSRSAPPGATTARCTRASTSGAAASSTNTSAAATPCTIRSARSSTCRFTAWGNMSASSTAGCVPPCGATACGANITTASPTPSSSPAGSCCAASRTSTKRPALPSRIRTPAASVPTG